MNKIISLSLIAVGLMGNCKSKQTTSVENKDTLPAGTTLSEVPVPLPSASSEPKVVDIKIISQIEEQKQEVIDYDQDYFDNATGQDLTHALVIPGAQAKFLPDSIYLNEGDSVYFMWKITLWDSLSVIDFVTTPRNAKGRDFIHNVITVDKSGTLIDCRVGWAALYAVSVDNPSGGTSAGTEFKTGRMDWTPALRFHSKTSGGKESSFEFYANGHLGELIPRF